MAVHPFPSISSSSANRAREHLSQAAERYGIGGQWFHEPSWEKWRRHSRAFRTAANSPCAEPLMIARPKADFAGSPRPRFAHSSSPDFVQHGCAGPVEAHAQASFTLSNFRIGASSCSFGYSKKLSRHHVRLGMGTEASTSNLLPPGY